VFRFFEQNVERVRDLLFTLVPTLPTDPPGYPEAVGPLDVYEQ
jgi:hypothetical protein